MLSLQTIMGLYSGINIFENHFSKMGWAFLLPNVILISDHGAGDCVRQKVRSKLHLLVCGASLRFFASWR